ncbi:hypothetical protein HYPBUDRAFT_153288 [Hyphopichia burtonii NRRL Y-1933]|uniref:BZIP domain-containing protein n=1 Tax=Hyphopichia burtonii NRRL Y-1933 TaxID=984485 RepID=A0A1E4RGP7_9ASCO|nr:hypothetical protein HYPBUDRAFT_153288 [Hyphopichia burtonii NRRL Y-1933]ODV66447.1 hypothetical protein HYPBUDRAFT_153288 [Hyphopichia burtonii NRRL Y-1933]
MSQSASNPMILSGDSMFESADLFAAPHPNQDVGEHQAVEALPARQYSKDQAVSELSSHLPAGDDAPKQGATSPFNIHSDVLDSVFSTSLEDRDQFQDHTPMFDELDFIIDGSKVNSKDDWVSLFGDHQNNGEDLSSTIVKDEDLDEVLFMEPPQTTTTQSSPESFDSTPIMDDVSQSTKASSIKSNRISKPKKKVDHLGVTAFAKKQKAQDLDPIAIDSSDPAALKRAKNTEAARRSRARKMERMSQLEKKVEDLLNDKTSLENEVIRLRELLSMNGVDY